MNNNTVLKIILAALGVVVIGAGIYYFAVARNGGTDLLPDGGINQPTTSTPNTPTPTSTPPQADNLIRVTAPQPNALVQSPLTIEGQARGNWYFEASFPVRLLDANGRQLAAGPAQAQSDWMTEAFVPFRAVLTFTAPTTTTGTLVLQKDNPSGLPQFDDERRIPVRFTTAQRTVTLYYYDADKDKDAQGNVLCSDKGLVGVTRTIPVTITPIQDTLRLLIQGNLTAQERAAGITTEFPLAGVELRSASLSNGQLTLEVSDAQNRTVGGSCRVNILRAQVEATAKQFPEVRSVRYIPAEILQP